jgi:hypothetical protein
MRVNKERSSGGHYNVSEQRWKVVSGGCYNAIKREEDGPL